MYPIYLQSIKARRISRILYLYVSNDLNTPIIFVTVLVIITNVLKIQDDQLVFTLNLPTLI